MCYPFSVEKCPSNIAKKKRCPPKLLKNLSRVSSALILFYLSFSAECIMMTHQFDTKSKNLNINKENCMWISETKAINTMSKMDS